MSGADLVFIFSSIAKSAVVVGVVLGMVAYSVVAERRFSAMIQDRIGPNRTGIPLTNIRLFGLGQPIADGLKFLLKEEFTPAFVNKFYFTLAPALAMIPALVTLAVIPFGSTLDLRPLAAAVGEGWGWTAETVEAFNIPAVIADLDIGLLFIFAIVSISVYGIVLAGWASNSKFPFLGGIRASAQMISYELSMGLAVVPVFLLVGHLNLGNIIDYQIENGWLAFPLAGPMTLESLLFWAPLFLSFILFLVAAFAETNRLPFDLAECETELVGGYHTEYSAMKFALFFLGEYAAMIVASAVMVTVFLGGWSLPLPWFNGLPMPVESFQLLGLSIPVPAALAGMAVPWWFGLVHILVFVGKVALFIFFFIWVRWTLPRFRYDQLMNLGWKVFIPLGFVNIFIAAFILAILRNP
jgi:NADH-quinone oxidoreductase subunit H